MGPDAIDYQAQQPLQYTQPLAVTNTQPSDIVLYKSQQGSIPPSVISQLSHNIEEKSHEENIYCVNTLCETFTKFTNYH